MGETGGYTLHLYCDCDGAAYNTHGHNNNIGEFAGGTRSICIAQARNRGWTKSKGKWLSPQCNLEGRKVRKSS